MYPDEELLPPRRPTPTGASQAPVWVVAVLIALSLGIAFGAMLPGSRAERREPLAATGPDSARPAPVAPAVAAAGTVPGSVTARVAPPGDEPVGGGTGDVSGPESWMSLGPVEPGRSYSPVGGPGSVMDAGTPEPVLAVAPSVPVADAASAAGARSASGAPAAPRDSAAPEPATTERRRAPAPRPQPRNAAARLSAAEAASAPLLAVRLGSGRVVFHETGAGNVSSADLEGQWSVVGRCGQRLRLDLAQAARGVGAVRGIGTDESASEQWELAVAVPSQGCGAASGRLLRARSASASDRGRFGALGDGDLAEAVVTGGTAWLVFRGPAGHRAVLATEGPGGWRESWSRDFAPGEALTLAGGYRRSEGAEGWFIVWRRGSPEALQRVPAGGGASAPALLRG